MKKVAFLILIFVFLVFASKAQIADSLKHTLSTSLNDTLRVKALNDLVWDNAGNYPLDAELLAKEALVLAQKTGNKNALSDCYNTLANLYHQSGRLEQALYYHQQALKIRMAINDQVGIIKSFNNLGTVYQKLSQYEKANDYFFKGLKPALVLKDSLITGTLYMNIGNSYASMDQPKMATEYFRKALQLSNKEFFRLKCLVNISNQYFFLKDFAVAEKYFEEALNLAKELDDKPIQARLFSNISQVYLAKKEYAKAEKVIQQSLKINREINNQNGLCLDYLALASLSEELDKPAEVIEFAKQAFELAKTIGQKPQEKYACLMLAKAYEKMGNSTLAYANMKSYAELSDSLALSETASKLNRLEIEHANQQKEKALELLKEQERNQQLEAKNRNIILGGSLLLILGLAFVAYGRFRRYKLKQQLLQAETLFKERELRTRAILEAENRERIRIAKDIHDDLGSGLSKIRFLSANINAQLSPEVRPVLDSISETSGNLVENMRELIWIADPENNELESLVARIREYTSDYLQDFPVELNFDIAKDIPQTSVSRDAYRHLFSSVKEGLQNIIKHSGATVVSLAIRIEKEELFISLKDNGSGFDVGQGGAGNGLRNLNFRMSKLGGKVVFESAANQGTTVTLTVSLEAINQQILL